MVDRSIVNQSWNKYLTHTPTIQWSIDRSIQSINRGIKKIALHTRARKWHIAQRKARTGRGAVDTKLVEARRQPARQAPHQGHAEARGGGRLVVESLPWAGGGGGGVRG